MEDIKKIFNMGRPHILKKKKKKVKKRKINFETN